MVDYSNMTISMSSLVNMDVALQKLAETNLLLLSISTATWIALVTASISVWLATRRHPKTSVINVPRPVPGPDPFKSACDENKEREERDEAHMSSSYQSLGQQVLEPQYMNDSPKKSRFTKRYGDYAWDECQNSNDIYGVIDQGCQDKYGGMQEVIGQEGEGYKAKERDGIAVFTKWDMGLIRGDLGWYRCQDFTVFDGNVVRFWDSCCNLQFVD